MKNLIVSAAITSLVLFGAGSTLLGAGSTLPGAGVNSLANGDPSSTRIQRSDDMRTIIEQFVADHDSLNKKYQFELSHQRQVRMAQFYRAATNDLQRVDFQNLDQDSKIDYLLLKNRLNYLSRKLELETQQDTAIRSALPDVEMVIRMWESKIVGKPIEGQSMATDYFQMQKTIQQLKKNLSDPAPQLQAILKDPTLALWTLERLQAMQSTMNLLHRYYNGYDPDYSWWARKPFEDLSEEFSSYQQTIRLKVLGNDSSDPNAIVGQPIGREALYAELENAMIGYSPEALVEIAKKEMKWCDQEMDKAANELGFSDWRIAQESVKDKFVPPGQQTYLIRQMAEEAADYVTAHDLVTVPDLAREVWGTQMMSPERQKVNPYFLGGDTIIVSYPTDEMSHPDKLMSLRGNNPHFSRAVVHHELIPGHHLQMFMMQRHRAYRSEFRTPFWMEGWALYWEMLLWDRGFARSPEDKIGMLFWRKHRCARIIFSLSYHLKQMTATQCIDYLVERVGHERNNATAEVRRSIMGGYGPLYQAAYMLGGLQIRSLYKKLVANGTMSDKEFHDMILHQNSIPIEMVRARLENLPLTPQWKADWKFYQSLESEN